MNNMDLIYVNLVKDDRIKDVYYKSLKDPPRCHKDGWKTCVAHYSQGCNQCRYYKD